MKSSIEGFCTSALSIPSEAIVFYRNADAGRSCTFATHHEVRFSDGKSELAPGKPLTAKNVIDLAKQANAGLKQRIEVLPDNVLLANDQALAWWTPAAQHYMTFDVSMHQHEGKARLQGVSGLVPCPALVFVLQRSRAGGGAFQGLSIYGLHKNERPKAETPLARAPVLNVGDNGDVCWGDGLKPKGREVSDIPAWQALFFSSAFTHYNGSVPMKCDDPYTFIADMLDRKVKRFPAKALKSSSKTLVQVLIKASGS